MKTLVTAIAALTVVGCASPAAIRSDLAAESCPTLRAKCALAAAEIGAPPPAMIPVGPSGYSSTVNAYRSGYGVRGTITTTPRANVGGSFARGYNTGAALRSRVDRENARRTYLACATELQRCQ